MKIVETTGAITIAAMLLIATCTAVAADHSMGFFVTSIGIGEGADLGGLKGVDAHCTQLAEAAGSK